MPEPVRRARALRHGAPFGFPITSIQAPAELGVAIVPPGCVASPDVIATPADAILQMQALDGVDYHGLSPEYRGAETGCDPGRVPEARCCGTLSKMRIGQHC
ncbi:hypothetical protein TUM18999_34380 [Pseudomonas tohonis]|uniref:Uncharacterized protein n=1 Tax=Pseudomonas tohonis TaxID=2725477 RepID=A0A6J4E5Z3_9PSED|nr:hypothetical protein TUM18999_34380 [Pseudomonas tohonis]GJN56271.1 hypothetical protein TUM20286_60230 [Pseudomonas tohonis]